MNAQTRSYLELHISVILWGFTAVLGKIIKMPAADLVLWRCFLTAVSLLFLIRPLNSILKINKAVALRFLIIGMIFGTHWLTFFGAVKLSNASVTLVCMSTCAFFASLLEPLILKSRFNSYNTFIGILIIPSMYLIFNSVEVSMHLGIWMGLLSSLLAAFTVTINKKVISELDPLKITLLEMIGACLTVLIFKIFYPEDNFITLPDANDAAILVFLALACTTLTWVLVLRSLKKISAFAMALAVNLEAVYGIVLSSLLLQEHQKLDREFYIGATMIILLVFTYPFISRLTLSNQNK